MGDDVLTTGQADYQLRVTTSSSSAMSGTFRLEFHGSYTTFNANADQESDTTCKTFMERLDGIGTVTCTRAVTDATSKSATYTVAITAWPFPNVAQNNIYSHEGSPPITDFACITSSATSSNAITCGVTLLSNSVNHKEYIPCSRRGACSYGTGRCKCHKKFGGLACNELPTSSEVDCTEADMTVHSTCSTVTGTIMNIQTTKSSQADFYFLDTLASGTTLFRVRGDGYVDISIGGMKIVGGGETIANGGLQIPVGGSTVNGGGLLVDEIGAVLKQSDESQATFTTWSKATGTTFAGDALVIKSTRSSNSAFNLLHLKASTTTMFTVDGTGKTVIHKGGFDIKSGGGSIVAGGLHCYEGTTIISGGLIVDVAGVTITNTGLQVLNGGAMIKTTPQTAPAVNFLASDASFASAVLRVKAKRQEIGLFTLIEATSNGVMRMSLKGDSVMTLSNGNEVLTGGMTVAAGGMIIKGGETIYTGGLNIPLAGATVTAGGFVVNEDAMVVKSNATATQTFVTSQAATNTNTGVKIHSARAANAAFKFLKLESTAEKFSVYGNGDVAALATTVATSSATGTVRLLGGLGVAKQLYTGGIVSVESDLQSTSFTTGALTVAGGLGVAHDLYVGGIVVVHTGSQTQPHGLTGETRVRSYSNTPSLATSFTLQRSRGTAGSKTGVHSGDHLGEMHFKGYVSDGSGGGTYLAGGEIRTEVENAGAPVSTNQMGSKIMFSTVASGGNTLVDRVQVNMAQELKVLTTTEATDFVTGSMRTMGGLFVAKSAYTGGPLYATYTDTAANAVSDVTVIGQSVSASSSSAVGIGAAVQLGVESAGGNIEMGSIDVQLTNINDGAEEAGSVVRLVTGGTVVDCLSVSGVRSLVHPTTASTSATTGSLVVAGGAGIAKSLYTTGQLVSKIADTSAGISEALHLRRTTSQGSGENGIGLGVSFHLEDSGDLQKAGAIEFVYTDATAKSSKVDVKVRNAGGAPAMALSFVGSTGVDISATTASTSSTTGSLVVGGGIGVGKSMYAAGQLVGSVTDTANSGVSTALVLEHSTSNVVANNVGTALTVGVEGPGGLKPAARLGVKLTDKTHAGANAQFEASVIEGGTSLASSPVAFKSTPSLTTLTANMVSTGVLTVNGDVTVGNAAADTSTWTGTVQGASPIVFEGATRNAITTTLAIESLSADRQVTLPDVDGTVITTGNRGQIVRTGTLSSLTVSGLVTVNQHTVLGNAAADLVTVQGRVQQVSGVSLTLQGASGTYLTTLGVTTPLGSDRTITLPDATGTVISEGNLNDVTSFGTITSLAVAGSTTFQTTTTIGDAEGDTVELEGTIQGANPLVFEGATANDFETTVSIIDPTADNTITLPGVDGTVITTGNQQHVTSTGTLTGLTAQTVNLNGNLVLTDSSGSNRLTVSGKIYDFNSRALEFEGTTGSTATTKLVMTAVTGSSKVIKLPSATGTIITVGNPTDLISVGTLTSLTVSGTVALNGNVVVGNAGADTITFNGEFFGNSPLLLDGNAGGSFTTVALESPDSPTQSKSITLPDATGIVISEGNLDGITVTGTLAGVDISGATTLNGNVAIGNSASADGFTVKGTVQGTTPLSFDGATANAAYTNIGIIGPTGSSKTITLPDASGTVVTTTHQTQVTSTGTIGALTMTGATTFGGNVDVGNLGSDQLTINGLLIGEYPLIFAGSTTSNSHVTKLEILAPTSANKAVTVPSACDGTIITTGNLAQITTLASMTAIDVAATGTSTISGTATTISGQTTFAGVVQGSTPFTFEGLQEFSDPKKSLNLAVSGPSADRTIKFPDVTGTIITAGNYGDVTSTGTRDTMAVTGTSTFQGTTTFGDGVGDTVTIGGTVQSSVAFSGPAGGSNVQTVSVESIGVDSDQTLVLPDVSGEFITTGNLGDIVSLGTLNALTVSNSLTANTLDVADSTVTQQTNVNAGVAVSTAVGRITTVGLTLTAGTCQYFYVTPSGCGWSGNSIVHLTIVGYGGSNGFPSAMVAARTNADFYAGICNAHPSAALDGAATIGYAFF
jgi:hypothetical protein